MPHEIRPRRCANCHAYVGRECLNLVSFQSESGNARTALPWDNCDDHQTAEEAAALSMERPQ